MGTVRKTGLFYAIVVAHWRNPFWPTVTVSVPWKKTGLGEACTASEVYRRLTPVLRTWYELRSTKQA